MLKTRNLFLWFKLRVWFIMKKKLLFDATVIANAVYKNAGRSGIFFASYNILAGLVNSGKFDVYLYSNLRNVECLNGIIGNDECLREKLQIAPMFSKRDLAQAYWLFQKSECKRHKLGLRRKLYVKFRLLLAEFLSSSNRRKEKFLKSVDFYFSPMEAVPKEIASFPNIKKFVFLHDAIPVLFPDFYPEMKKGGYWYQALLDSLNKKDIYFANSQSTKNDFVRLFPQIDKNNIHVVPLAASDNFYCCQDEAVKSFVRKKYNIPEGVNYIFSLCTLEPRKNLIFAVKNFIRFVRENNLENLYLVLGGGHWDSFIKSLEDEIGNFEEYKKFIVRAGYVDDEDLAPLFSGAEFFIYPSLYEGFGMPVLEAMQCGCPVICSETSSMPEVIGDAGIMFNPRDDEAFLNALKQMYEDENFRKKSAQRGLLRAKEFSWKKTADLIIEELNHA